MARRIELPSADVLFADAPAVPPSRTARKGAAAPRTKAAAAKASKPATRKKAPVSPKSNASKKSPAASKPATSKKRTATPKPSTRKRSASAASTPRTLRATPVARLEYVEERLADMPVDALIDLRDGLEELLAADVVDEAAVRRLLDAVEV